MPTYRRGSSLGRDRHTSGVARGSEWDLFVNRLRSAPVAMASIPGHLPALRAAVAMIRIPATSEPSPPLRRRPDRIVVDESRMEEMSEAHVPVTTEFGPGILVWSNSD
ncbi:DUF6210 family protein [Embleya sp. NPDC020630]|uniref:DUF6210 family protein n=1 Tax=Embleya sp. NPDC020630 TaxID=3363979 RepID=UPI0037A8923C